MITTAFRKWKRASVVKGTKLKTAVGLVEIGSVEVVAMQSLTGEDASAAGFTSVAMLLKTLAVYPEGVLYKISVRYFSEDPRIALRETTELGDAEKNLLKEKLLRLDRYSPTGPWTLEILKAIQSNPRMKAADLALVTGREKSWLKLNIRKLKNLGLTVSHDPGYTMSPLGTSFMEGKL